MGDGDLMATLGTRRALLRGERIDHAEEGDRGRIEKDRMWFEERFYDPDHPIDSDWLQDAEMGRLFMNDGVKGNLGVKRLSVNEAIMREAERLMDSKGLTQQYRPRLVVLHSDVYAVRPYGDAIRLDHSLFWERETGFADMVDEQVDVMHSELYAVPCRRPSQMEDGPGQSL